MDNEKIIQIIPAPDNLLLRYRMDDGKIERWRSLCLALVELENGDTEVKLVDIDSYGVIEFADTASNFNGIDWKEATPNETTPK